MFEEDDLLLQYGVARRSGRYPWGSGEEPHQSSEFLNSYIKLKKDGLSQVEIAEKLGMNTRKLRNNITWARNEQRTQIAESVGKLREAGMTDDQIGEKFGVSGATIRGYRSTGESHRATQFKNVTQVLADAVDKHKYLDVGAGVELQLGIPGTRLKAVVDKMVTDGDYYQHSIFVDRLGQPDKPTTVKVLTKEQDVHVVKKHEGEIRSLEAWSDDGGETIFNINPPKAMDPKKVMIRYADQGGKAKDGVIELRPGVDDLEMGNSRYAQVRIKVGEDRFLKGMAVYGNPKDFPDGKDIIFNTNKGSDVPFNDVLKKVKEGELGKYGDNIFGGAIMRQNKSNVLNIVNEEGTWDTWSHHLASQFLSKQPTTLVKDRLDATHKKLKEDLDEIESLDNAVVKDYLLSAYSLKMNTKASKLEAEGLPKTKSHVILPFPDMKPDQIYAPHYDDGDRVVLIRYPHAGIFEIPELTVNNKHASAKRVLGNAPDAVGIHPSVAEKLSGADFDGDTVTVIKNRPGPTAIKSSRALPELKNFDPMDYKMPMPKMTKDEEKKYKARREKAKENEMGKASNLITDMTIKGASDSEIARAVKYSMVVIDSAKHNLDYQKCARDNDIKSLKKTWQTHIDPITGKKSVGSSTLISRSKTVVNIEDPDFDASKYSSKTQVENLYVGYIKKVTTLKGRAEKVRLSLKMPKYDPDAAKVYADEVTSLNKKLDKAMLNAPRERQAQILSNKIFYTNYRKDMSKDDIRKLRNRSITRARMTVGARGKEATVEVTPREWEAIQKRAVSTNKIKEILKYSDMDKIKQLATPRAPRLTPSQKAKAQQLYDSGKYTYAQISESIGLTVNRQSLLDD